MFWRMIQIICLGLLCCSCSQRPDGLLSEVVWFNGEYFSAITSDRMDSYEVLERHLCRFWASYAREENNGLLVHLLLRQRGRNNHEEYLQDEMIQKLLRLEEETPWLYLELYYPPDYPKGFCHE